MSAPEDPRIWQGLRSHLDELGSLPTVPPLGTVLGRPTSRRPVWPLAGLGGVGVALLLIGLVLPSLRPATAPVAVATPTSSGSATSSATAVPDPVDWGDLIGNAYVAVRASMGGEPVALIPDRPLGLRFTDGGRFGASFGCNGGGGNYEIREGRLVTSSVYVTAMACLGPRGELEGWYYPFLLSGPTITPVPAGFVLTSGDAAVTYLDARLAPSPPAWDPTWVGITGPQDSLRVEKLVLEMNGMAWDGYGGVASVPTSQAIVVRLIGRETCRVYAEFVANPGSSTVIRFSKDGQVTIEDWTGRVMDAGPVLPHERLTDCPVA